MNNLDIFICAHRKFELPVKNGSYKILSLGNNTELYGNNIFRDDTNDNISNMNAFYSELTGYYWVWKNYKVKEYIGFCHYRRYFDFLDNIPNISELKCDIILPKPLKFNTTIYNQYASCHNIEDLECVKEIIITKYNVPEKLVNYVFNEQTFMFCNNIFIMKKEHFYDYCNFIFNVLNDYLNLNKLNNIQDVFQFISTNEKKYLKNFYPNNEIKYQSRIGGAISERLLNVYVLWKNLDINISSLIITEDKYNNINEKDFL